MKKQLSLVISLCLILMSAGGVTAQTPPLNAGGDGSVQNPYKIATADQFLSIFTDAANMSLHYIQIDNIDLSGKTHTPISTAFTGTYTGVPGIGDTHRTINLGSGASAGLFTTIGPAGKVEKIGVLGTITSGAALTGSIAGTNQGTIENCYSGANITSTAAYTGGIAGSNAGTISKCYTFGNISGISQVGGIAGGFQNASTATTIVIDQCYVTGTVSAANANPELGGILGGASPGALSGQTYKISNNYFAGTLSNNGGGNREGGILGYGINRTRNGNYTVTVEYNFVISPNVRAEKIIGTVTSGSGGSGTKTITGNENAAGGGKNFSLSGVGGTDGTVGIVLTFDEITGPDFNSKITAQGVSESIWGFLPEGGDPGYKFPQLKNTPHKTPITNTTITNTIETVTTPLTVTSVDTDVNNNTKVTVDTAATAGDTITMYEARVKTDGGTDKGTVSSSTNVINITSLLGGVEGDYTVAVKAKNGYKKNYLDEFGNEFGFTYVKVELKVLDTPAVTLSYSDSPVESYVLNWEAVDEAEFYEIQIADGAPREITANTLDITNDVTVEDDYAITVTAKGEGAASLPALINACSYFGGGAGTVQNPYKVYNLRHLYNIGKPGKSDKVFEQVKDISNFQTPIDEFSGVYKGAAGAPKIIGLEINETDEVSVGFIRALTGSGIIENIEMQGTVVANGISASAGSGTVNFVGAFAGIIVSNEAIIRNCVNRANVTNNGVRKSNASIGGITNSTNGTGGIAGLTHNGINPTIENCKNFGDITVTHANTGNAGGIVGYSNTQNISGCENSGKIEAPSTAGGIAGANYGKITRSKNLRSIILPNTNQVGGIAGTTVLGAHGVTLSECFNNANVYGREQVGGLCGTVQGGSGSTTINITIENSFNSGGVYGTANTGALVGLSGHTTRGSNLIISNSYSASGVTTRLCGGEAAGSVKITADSAYYLDDKRTDNTNFEGTALEHADLANLLTSKPGEFSQDYWTAPPAGYSYPVLKNCGYMNRVKAIDTIVNISVSGNGAAAPTGEEWIEHEESITLTLTPDAGHFITTIELNGIAIVTNEYPEDAEAEYEIGPIVFNSDIVVTFAPLPREEPGLEISPYIFSEAGEFEIPVLDSSGTVKKELFNGPKGVVFTKEAGARKFTLIEYGMLFSKSNSASFTVNVDGSKNVTSADADVLKVKALGKNDIGQFSVLFYGPGLLYNTDYYIRAYGVYTNDQGEVKVYYAPPASFKTSAEQ